MTKNRNNWMIGAALVAAGASTMACGEDAAPDGAGGGGGETAAPATGTEPLYAMMVQVYTAEDRIVYVHLTKDLELGDIDLSGAREFPSVANFTGIDGRVLVSSGTEPEISEFGISDDLQWIDGRTVSFASFPLEDNANFYYQYILDDQTAYMPFEATKRIVWNPSTMTIDGVLEDTNVELSRGNLNATVGGNRNAIEFDGPVQQPFFYVDEDWFEYGPESVVAIYDEKTNEEQALVTLPCPALSMASQDEAGYTYYGSWSFMDRALFGEGPEPCVARLKPDLTLDEAWTSDLEDITDGRLHNNFRVVGGGKAIANVLHTELLEDADFESGYDAALVDAIYKSGPHWKLWLIDLEARTGGPIEGIDVDTASGAQFAVLDGRTFVFLPYEDWGRTKIYEIGADGVATEHGDTVGDVFKWVKIR